MSFFEELKRRNVFRVGIAYLIASWLILQVIDVVAPILEIPNWIGRAILLFLGVGFIVAVFLAWAYELTPEGVKREEDVDRSKSITPRTGRKLDFIIIGALVIALGYFVWERQFYERNMVAEPGAVASESIPLADDITIEAPVAEAPRSIAVLPFANFSSDEEQQWFSDGLTEEILNALARMPDLLVAARTSSYAYKDTQLDIPAISEALGVDHILEGSVRRGGDQLRITAQLIRAEDGFHLWSETYDRSPDDVIAIQEDIATQIARALNIALDPEALAEMVSAGTGSVPAYEAYLSGLGLLVETFQSGDEYQSLEARDALQEAIAYDPEFSRAHYRLFTFWRLQLDLLNITSGITENTDEERRQYRDNHLTLAIEHEQDETIRLLYLSWQERYRLNFQRALQYANELIALRPFSDEAYVRTMLLYRDMGLHQSSRDLIDQHTDIFLRMSNSTALALTSVRFSKDPELMRRLAGEAIDRFGDSQNIQYQVHRTLLWAGDIDGASGILPAVKFGDMPEDNRLLAELRQLCAENRVNEASRVYAEILEKHEDQTGAKWLGHMIMGEHDAAREMLMTYDDPDGYTVLSEFLHYSHFDPQDYPNFTRTLAGSGIEDREVRDVPYQCGR